MFKEFLLNIFANNKGKVIGSIIGFIISILLLTIGFFRTLLIVICVSAGYYIGKQVDNRVDFMELLGKLIPPGWKK